MAFCADEVLAAPQTVSYVSSCVPRGGLTAASVKGTRRGCVWGSAVRARRRCPRAVPRQPRARRVASYSRARSFTIRRGRLKPGTYLARLRIRTASGGCTSASRRFVCAARASSAWPRSAATSSAASSSGWRWPARCSRASGSAALPHRPHGAGELPGHTRQARGAQAAGGLQARRARPGGDAAGPGAGRHKVRMSVRGPGGMKSGAVIAFRPR